MISKFMRNLTSRAAGRSSRSRAIKRIATIFAVACATGAVFWYRDFLKPARLELSAIAPAKRTSHSEADSADYVGYLGSAACAECHPGEVALASRSKHSKTLMRGSRSPLTRFFVDRTIRDPGDPEVSWRYRLRGDELEVEREEKGKKRVIKLDYAVGSGRNGATFVSLSGPAINPEGIKHRFSYMTKDHKIIITPGEPIRADGGAGRGVALSADIVRECFGCHSSRTSAKDRDVLDPATMQPNVDCERCHGPGEAHVAAMRGGLESIAIRFGAGKEGPHAELKLCGECHRLPSGVYADQFNPDHPLLLQFQPIGLKRSECYKNTKSGLACTTCHDPHARLSIDISTYDSRCMNCHRSPGGKACDVSPRGGCVNCHMPERTTPDGFVFHDHWIRIHSDTEKPTTKSKGADHVE